MMATYNIEPASVNDYDQIINVWEASVRATHEFLSESDLLLYKELLSTKYLAMVKLYCIKTDGQIAAFAGVAGNSIEMLFAHPSHFGKGVGRSLTEFAIRELGCRAVDVNEQNRIALLFYIKMGFDVTGRSETDGLGKPYPILHLQLAT
ncbi:GNAT family N-acetyltransferase [Flavobacterium selenitireducens]|uniref:GNAT family N-acetyltransferase n=1 Tax=Flavobacterium selenitireducens TaxID=2722704 RepID=UPI00168B9657|nr:GNAT family N-acetyltransferase [Flavobacterium selenitireducens]MBD3581304.1 GNAT family N-acetyltransferase [Flavobacterium selenitireducens]